MCYGCSRRGTLQHCETAAPQPTAWRMSACRAKHWTVRDIKKQHFLLRTDGTRHVMHPVRVFDNPDAMRAFSSKLGWRVFRELAEPACPMDIARKLGVHEQKVYYYIRTFRKAGLIRETGTESRGGATARLYQARFNSLCVSMGEPSAGRELNISSPAHLRLLKPFIDDGNLNAKIIVGSPDPHGPWKARASDSCCAIDFALFMGAFTSGKQVPNYMLDTDVRESDLTGNLILIGGPTVNMVTRRINSILPVFIDLRGNAKIRSRLSGKSYNEDEVGMVVIVDNPLDRKRGSKILVIAGNRFQGTRSAVLAWVKSLDKLMAGNANDRKTIAKVVRGYDMDGDGVIDTPEILE